MALETGVTYIEDLVTTNPVGATDNVDEGDDHIRNIKTAVKGSFPNLGATAVTATAAEINDLPTKTGSETLTNKTLTSPVINTGVSGTAIDTDTALSADSDTLLASQKATKAYVDGLVAAGINGITFYAGAVDDTGTLLHSNSGVTTSRVSLGIFKVTHNFNSLNYSVNFMQSSSVGGNDVLGRLNHTTGSGGLNDVQVIFRDIGGTLTDCDFHYQIFKY